MYCAYITTIKEIHKHSLLFLMVVKFVKSIYLIIITTNLILVIQKFLKIRKKNIKKFLIPFSSNTKILSSLRIINRHLEKMT